MLLAGKGFLQAHGAAIAAAITPLMSDSPPDGLKALCAMCDTVMVAFGAAGCRLLQAPLAAALGDVLEQGHGDQQGFGHRLGLLLRCAAAAHDRPRARGRVVLVDPDLFYAMANCSTAAGERDAVDGFVELWLTGGAAPARRREPQASGTGAAVLLHAPEDRMCVRGTRILPAVIELLDLPATASVTLHPQCTTHLTDDRRRTAAIHHGERAAATDELPSVGGRVHGRHPVVA